MAAAEGAWALPSALFDTDAAGSRAGSKLKTRSSEWDRRQRGKTGSVRRLRSEYQNEGGIKHQGQRAPPPAQLSRPPPFCASLTYRYIRAR